MSLLLILIILLAALALFAALNWTALTAPTALSFVFGTVQAPIGLIMLGFTVAIVVAFLVYIVYLQSSVVLEARRQARELQTQRELADRAEASRFTELREYPQLVAKGIRNTGSMNFGGVVATAGGLLFVAATAGAEAEEARTA